MKFVEIENRKGMVNLDGYSNRKTLRGALKDLAREVAKIDKGEAEEVSCASRFNEDTDEMEYAEGNWYLYIRFAAC